MEDRPTSASDHLLRTVAAVPLQSRILQLGCGEGRQCEQLARLGFDLYACDVDPEAVIQTRERLRRGRSSLDEVDRRIISANAASLGFPDDYFDWVVAHGVYQRAASLDNVAEMIDETRRVLRPGGWLHCAVPACTQAQEGWEQVDAVVFQNGPAIGAFFTTETLGEVMEQFDMAEAEAPFAAEIGGEEYLCAIYRKVNSSTPA